MGIVNRTLKNLQVLVAEVKVQLEEIEEKLRWYELSNKTDRDKKIYNHYLVIIKMRKAKITGIQRAMRIIKEVDLNGNYYSEDQISTVMSGKKPNWFIDS